MTPLSLTLLIFPLLMMYAAFSDLFTMRITNALVVAVVGAFAVLAVVTGMPWDTLVSHVIWAVGILVVAFTFFAFGWIGGGDAKFAAATALWIGPVLLLPYVIYAGLLGGVLTLVILGLRNWPLPDRLQKWTWLDRLHDRRQGVPYGIALAAAGILVYPNTAVFQHFLA